MSARSEALILARVKNAAAKGKGYQLGDGYYACWTKDAKKLADAGKIVIKRAHTAGAKPTLYLPGKQTKS